MKMWPHLFVQPLVDAGGELAALCEGPLQVGLLRYLNELPRAFDAVDKVANDGRDPVSFSLDQKIHYRPGVLMELIGVDLDNPVTSLHSHSPCRISLPIHLHIIKELAQNPFRNGGYSVLPQHPFELQRVWGAGLFFSLNVKVNMDQLWLVPKSQIVTE